MEGCNDIFRLKQYLCSIIIWTFCIRGQHHNRYNVQVAVLPRSESGHDRKVELVPLNSLNFQQRTQILDMALKTKDMDNELFLRKVRSTLDRCIPQSFPAPQTGRLAASLIAFPDTSKKDVVGLGGRVGTELPLVDMSFDGL